MAARSVKASSTQISTYRRRSSEWNKRNSIHELPRAAPISMTIAYASPTTTIQRMRVAINPAPSR